MGSTAYLESDNSPPIQKKKRERKFSVNNVDIYIPVSKRGLEEENKHGAEIWFLVVSNIFQDMTTNQLCENLKHLPYNGCVKGHSHLS